MAPKFVPEMSTFELTDPDDGDRLVMLGVGITVKGAPLLASPPTVTTTFPEIAPPGTGATMLVALQEVGTAAVPLKVTVLVLCVAPKFAPDIVTKVPDGPDAGFKPAMLGGVPPPPAAALNAAKTTPQTSD